MLQTIREKVQGWIAGIISALLIFSFAFWGIHSYFSSGTVTNAVAEVNGVEINKDQFSIAYERLRKQAQSRFINPAEQEGKIKEQALQSLINIEIMKQASASRGYFISVNQIDNYLQSMSEFQVDGQFSFDRFNELLSNSVLSTQDFLDLIKTNLLIDQPKLGIIFTSFALSSEVDQAISLIDQTRSVMYSTVSLDSVLHADINISDKKIADYYRTHQFEFKTPEKVSVSYIQLTLNEVKKNIHPEIEELKKFFTENANSYADPIELKMTAYKLSYAPQNKIDVEAKRNQAESLLNDLRAGKAAKESIEQMPFSGRYISITELPAELQKAVSLLSKTNEFSPVTDTGDAFIVVQLHDVKSPHLKTFEEVKAKVEAAYIKQKSEEIFADYREKLADLTYQHPNGLDVAAKELNLVIKTSSLFSLDKPSADDDISSHKKVRDVAFSHEILRMGNNSDVLSLDANSAMVIRLNAHVLPSVIPLASVSLQIKGKLKQVEIDKEFKKYLDRILKQLNSGKSPDVVASEFKFLWKKTDYVGRYAYSSVSDPLILDAAFTLPISLQGKHQANSQFNLVKLSDNKYAILSLLGVKAGEAKDDKQTTVFSEQVQNSLGMLEYELYKQSLLKNAKVSVFTSFDSSSK